MCSCHNLSKDRRNSEKYVFTSLHVKGQKKLRKVCVHVINCQRTEDIQKSMCSCHYLSKDSRNSEKYVFTPLPVKRQKKFRKVCVHVITCKRIEEIQKCRCSCYYLSNCRGHCRNSKYCDR